VVDVRPEIEFRSGHVSGARSIPVSELLTRLGELPRDVPVVAYCRGPYCVFADEAVALLTAHGYQAARLTDGFPEWQLAGFPVER
jgi:rhodanese-related sulfurtransferase